MYLYREYADKNFYVYLKKANKMYFIAMILSIISFVVNFIFFILFRKGITDTFANWSFWFYIIYLWFGVLDPILSYFNSKDVKKINNKESKLGNDYTSIRTDVIFIYAPLALSLLYLVYALFDSATAVAYFEMLGMMLFQYIFMIIASVNLINCLKIIKTDYQNNPPEYMKASTESKLKEQQIKEVNKQSENYQKYIAISGKKFFLKYYYIIRDLSFADAMDSIDDKYSYEDKEKRAQAVKKIFSLNLQKFALEKIIQEATGDINEEIKAEAEEIYKKEFTEIVTGTVT